ncbi:MAG TPA: hypothetical protein VJ183_02415 [Chloroflexia bacterium]|nr:hypothetical protein [Chloroflexia bacterium]
MQSATGQSKGAGTAKKADQAEPIVKKKLSRLTIVLALLITAGTLGILGLVLFGIWPPKESPREPSFIGPTPQAILAAGLKVEAVGQPVRDPNDNTQLILTVTVSNNLNIALPREGIPIPGAPPPSAGPVKLCSVDLKVVYYKINEQGQRELAGVGYGSVANVEYGQKSAPYPIYAAEIGDWQPGNENKYKYEIVPDHLWADNDCREPEPTPAARIEQIALRPSTP